MDSVLRYLSREGDVQAYLWGLLADRLAAEFLYRIEDESALYMFLFEKHSVLWIGDRGR